jgi:hypothetical protein
MRTDRGVLSNFPRRRLFGIMIALFAAVAFALSNASASIAYQGGSTPAVGRRLSLLVADRFALWMDERKRSASRPFCKLPRSAKATP